MIKPALVLFVMVGVGCESSKQDSKQQPAPAGSAAGSAAAGRPAVVTAEMADTFEVYVAAFEKLATDIEHAGTDCKAVLAVVQRDTKDLVALAPRGDRLRAAMQDAKGDHAAAEWFGATFAPRMKASSEKLRPLATACAKDTELEAALNEAMSQFPMMRKKS